VLERGRKRTLIKKRLSEKKFKTSSAKKGKSISRVGQKEVPSMVHPLKRPEWGEIQHEDIVSGERDVMEN